MSKTDLSLPYEVYSVSGSGVIVSPRFSDTAMEIIEISGADARIQVGTEYIDAPAGSFVYIPCGLVFSAENSGGVTTIRGLRFDKSIVESNMSVYENEILYMFYVKSENKIKAFEKTHPISRLLLRCINEAYEEYLSKDVCYRLPIVANIYLSVTALVRYYCSAEDELERMIYHNVLRLRPVITYIYKHFADKIYIEDLASIISVSDDYFTRMFKDSMGKTPVDYINCIRINRAAQILITTDKSVSDISDEIGFCNANYFNKIFKQYIGVTPLAYKKNKR